MVMDHTSIVTQQTNGFGVAQFHQLAVYPNCLAPQRDVLNAQYSTLFIFVGALRFKIAVKQCTTPTAGATATATTGATTGATTTPTPTPTTTPTIFPFTHFRITLTTQTIAGHCVMLASPHVHVSTRQLIRFRQRRVITEIFPTVFHKQHRMPTIQRHFHIDSRMNRLTGGTDA